MPIKPDPKAVSELQAHCHDRAVVELPNATSSKSMSQRMRALLCLGIFATNLITGGVNSAMGESYHSETEALTGQENVAETLSEKQAKYEGFEGYQKMLTELRESLYTEIPEAKGKVEIFDFSNDPIAEIERIEESLQLGDNGLDRVLSNVDRDINTIAGKAYPDVNNDNDSICIAAAWNPQNIIDSGYDLNFNTIKTLARINIHEVMHCLDDLVYNDEGYEQGWIVDAVRYGADIERFAEIGTQSLMLYNGDTEVSTNNLISSYDYGMLFRDDSYGLSYDVGDYLAQVLETTTSGEGLDSFYMTGWKEILKQTAEIRNEDLISQQEVMEKMYLREAMRENLNAVGTKQDSVEWLRSRQDIPPCFNVLLQEKTM